MATAKKLPSGNWRVQVSRTIDGNKVVKSFTAESKRQAEFLAAKWKNDNNDSVEDITVHEAMRRYILTKESVLSPNTLHSYRMMNDAYLKSIHKIKVKELTNEKIQIAINSLASEKSPKTVRNSYGLLTATLKMFRPEFVVNVTLPQKVKSEIVIPTKADIQVLLEYTKDKQMYIPIILAAFCGMREGEICALDAKDVHKNKITVSKSLVRDDELGWIEKPPKTFSGYRVIDCPDFVQKAIQGKRGRIVEYNNDSLRTTFKETLRRAGVHDFRFHDLRHYYVSELFDIGMPEKYIIAQVGHSSASITKKVYDHISSQKQNEYSQKIKEHFKIFV